MTLNQTITKKILETIVHETFSKFGVLSSSLLLDSLKFLGFHYATNAGISINIEDLKTPDLKKYYIETANQEIKKISQGWSEGSVSDQERFQTIIDSWNIATESLKDQIVDYYQNFDPANNLYIMAFSGARGNMSQVRQLVGMRGLMSDQEGKIIDLPIQANFREGLSSVDYIISSYGARKGIVDTALKTADSGYLTRRLIYLAQDLVIREIDCHSKIGMRVLLGKKTSIKNLIGRYFLKIKENEYPFREITEFKNFDQEKKSFEKINTTNQILDASFLEKLKEYSPIMLTVRGPLTCNSNGSICQKCYGWDLSQQKVVALGETVGIIAAQSIGEPGTQLTMRTFHTGGIFTGENLKQLFSPFSGTLFIPDFLKSQSYRTNHGSQVLKLEQEVNLILVNWKGFETNIFLEIGSYLYISKTSFVYKGQLISEILKQQVILPQQKLKPIYTRSSGRVVKKGQGVLFNYLPNKNVKVVLKPCVFHIVHGKIFSVPLNSKLLGTNIFYEKKAIANLKIVTPQKGIVLLNQFQVSIVNLKKKITIRFSELSQNFLNSETKIIPLVRNYQCVDENTILAYMYIYPKFTGEIVSIKKKQTIRNIDMRFIFFDLFKKTHASIVSIDEFQCNIEENMNKSKNIQIHKNKIQNNICRDCEIILLLIEKVKRKNSKNLTKFCIAFKKNTWNIYGPLGQKLKNEDENKNLEKQFQNDGNYPDYYKPKKIIFPTTFNNPILQIKKSGLQIEKDYFSNTYNSLDSVHLPISTIYNSKIGSFVEEKELFAILVNYTKQTDDIVQGLPKIEELIEARKPKIEACLLKYPGVFVKKNFIPSHSLFNFNFHVYSEKKKKVLSWTEIPTFRQEEFEKYQNLEKLKKTKLQKILNNELNTEFLEELLEELREEGKEFYGKIIQEKLIEKGNKKNKLTKENTEVNEEKFKHEKFILPEITLNQIVIEGRKKIAQVTTTHKDISVKKKGKKPKQILLIANTFKDKGKFLSHRERFFEIFYFSSLFKFDPKDFSFNHQITNKKLELVDKKFLWEKIKTPEILCSDLEAYFENKILNKMKKIDRDRISQFSLDLLDKTGCLSIPKMGHFSFDETGRLLGDKMNCSGLFSSSKYTDMLLYQIKDDKNENEYNREDYIIRINDDVSMYLKQVPMSITEHILPLTTKLTINLGDFIDIGEPITQGMIDSHELLNTLFVYHKEFDGIIKGMTRSLNKFQVILSQSIQAIYQDQGVNVSSKHIEILVKQLTSKVIIVSGGDTPFLAGELLSIAFIRDIYEIFNSAVDCSYKTPHFEPKLLSATNAALNKDGFLSAAGFQETRKILTKAAIEGKSDWLRGLKESLMSGRMIPAGSAFLNYKDYLNNVYRFKKKKNFKE